MNLPWFIFDLTNYQLITSNTIPRGEISDVKNVIFTETPVLGNNYSPIASGGNGNRKLSMQIPVINRGLEGNIALLKQFDILRNKSRGWLGIASGNQWANNPKVLYYWGVGGVPLEYYVTKCEMSHSSNMVNALGIPQHSTVNLELTLDEESKLYKIEEMYRDITAVMGSVVTLAQAINGGYGAIL